MVREVARLRRTRQRQSASPRSGEQLTSEWGKLPRRNERAGAWVERATRPKTDTDPLLIEAERAHRVARDEVLRGPERAQTARLETYGCIFGAERAYRNSDAYLRANPTQRTENASYYAHSRLPRRPRGIKQTRAEVACKAGRDERERTWILRSTCENHPNRGSLAR